MLEVGHRAGEAGTQQVPIALGLDYLLCSSRWQRRRPTLGSKPRIPFRRQPISSVLAAQPSSGIEPERRPHFVGIRQAIESDLRAETHLPPKPATPGAEIFFTTPADPTASL